MEKLQLHKNFSFYFKKVFPILLLFIFFFLIGYHCPIRLLLGISCPGCGMTRAWFSLLQFNVSKAFYYHPLFFLAPVFVYIILGKKPLLGNKKKEKIFYIFITSTFIIVYMIRMFFIPNEIVFIHIEKGYLFRFLNDILGGQ